MMNIDMPGKRVENVVRTEVVQSVCRDFFSRQAKTRRNFLGPSPTDVPYLPLLSTSSNNDLFYNAADGLDMYMGCLSSLSPRMQDEIVY